MSKFAFKLNSLLKYRRNRRDLCRQLLAQILDGGEKLKEKRRQVEDARRHQLDEFRDVGQRGVVDIDRASSRRFHSRYLVSELQSLDESRQLVLQQEQLCRQALTEADRDVKVLEKLKDKQQAEFLYHQERRTAQELEQGWLAARISEYSK